MDGERARDDERGEAVACQGPAHASAASAPAGRGAGRAAYPRALDERDLAPKAELTGCVEAEQAVRPRGKRRLHGQEARPERVRAVLLMRGRAGLHSDLLHRYTCRPAS